ncbi:MAG: hypothetical protein FWE11_08060 [Defluviitaleaceae bacterium]|nr:hypothetical protein [Defluviitaleaceae bacterium]
MHHTSKASITMSTIVGKILSLVGFGAVGLFGLVLIVMLAEGDTEAVIGSAVFIIPGLFMIIQGRKIKNRIRRFRTYVSSISRGTTSIDAMASFVGKSSDFVIRDLYKMISKNYFVNARVDTVTRQIIIGRPTHMPFHPQPHMPPHSQPHMPNPGGFPSPGVGGGHQPPAIDSYTCNGCGATGTKQRGFHIQCDYCGSMIK